MNETVQRYVVAGRRLLATLTGVGAVASSTAMHTEVMVLARRAREFGLTELAGRWLRLGELLSMRGRFVHEPSVALAHAVPPAHAGRGCHQDLESVAWALTTLTLEAQLSRSTAKPPTGGLPGDERRW